ncbi:MAG: 50S ribosomal protein L17 [Bacteroidota bacterium]
MRHGKKVNHLGRKTGHRKALLKNLAIALIQHKRINTTLAKAKALRVYLEPLVTKAKTNSTHSRRVVFSYLQNKDAINELFGPVAAKVGDRPGGYLRILKTGFRMGDGAETAIIEFVDFNEIYGKEEKKRKRTRRRGKKTANAPVENVETAVEEANDIAEVVDEVIQEAEDQATNEAEDSNDETKEA